MTFYGKLINKNDRLVYKNITKENEYNKFKQSIKEGDVVDVYMEITSDNGTLAQLAKIHAMIRQISQEIGYNSEDVKLLIKDKAGLILQREVKNKEFFIPKSFGDCSKDELSLVIQACIELGKELNLNLY